MCQILQPDGKYLFVRCADYRRKEDEFQHSEFIVNPCRACNKQTEVNSDIEKFGGRIYAHKT